jgi:hypothetical protein
VAGRRGGDHRLFSLALGIEAAIERDRGR